ncbi:MAG TPA: hypothetical protein VN777_11280 [Terriglobales bacterium]|nr:hypothetical protein [Terriglobales bacterium]
MSSQTLRILLSSVFLVSVILAADVAAQMTPSPATGGAPQTAPHKGGQNMVAAAEQNPACQRIIAECKNLGFIPGQWKKDNGLWKDCFDPVVKGGGSATRDGKPISVPVNGSDVQSCRAAVSHQR